MRIVADTSALVSLGVVADREPNPLDYLLDAHELAVPERVVSELEETAAYDDASGRAAGETLSRREQFTVRDVELDGTFPLDDGENAAVTLANGLDAVQLLCDEFNRIGLVHASLTGTRLVTTPSLLVALSRAGALAAPEVEALLDEISDARSWDGNAYVARARETLGS